MSLLIRKGQLAELWWMKEKTKGTFQGKKKMCPSSHNLKTQAVLSITITRLSVKYKQITQLFNCPTLKDRISLTKRILNAKRKGDLKRNKNKRNQIDVVFEEQYKKIIN